MTSTNNPMMQPAKPIPPVTATLEVASGQTAIIRGSVIIDSAGKAALADVNPLEILGVAQAPQDSAFGYGMANSPSPITGRKNTISYAVAGEGNVFSARLTSTATEQTVAVATHNNNQYGITKQSTGEWTVDVAKTGDAARVRVIECDLERNRVLFQFLPTAIA